MRLQGDVWICMELMDTSLDKFYKQVMEKERTIPEDILGKIAVSVSVRRRCRLSSFSPRCASIRPPRGFVPDRESVGASVQQLASHPQRWVSAAAT